MCISTKSTKHSLKTEQRISKKISATCSGKYVVNIRLNYESKKELFTAALARNPRPCKLPAKRLSSCEGSHLPTDVRSVPASRFTQSSQCVALVIRNYCYASRRESCVYDLVCIPELRCHKFLSRLTLSLSLGARTGSQFRVRGEKWSTDASSPLTVGKGV
jgi:hypothetical protein